mgnify:CR=1 FL=1
MHTVLDLFAGIGGFSLGLERVSGGYFKTGAFCEIDLEARKVLAKHWPAGKIYEDIKELTHERLQADGIFPSVYTLGFPCTDISNSGRRAGISGPQSSLWKEAFRLIRDVPQERSPSFCVIENVSVLRSRGLDVVLSDLHSVGYDAEWHCLPATTFAEAPHQRDRIWVIAYPRSARSQVRVPGQDEREERDSIILNDSRYRYARGKVQSPWANSSMPLRVDDGIPNRAHRLRQLGNAVIPAIPQLVGEAIMEYEKNE